jgi:hypothetical protein
MVLGCGGLDSRCSGVSSAISVGESAAGSIGMLDESADMCGRGVKWWMGDGGGGMVALADLSNNEHLNAGSPHAVC